MPFFTRYPTTISREVAEEREYRNFVENTLGYTMESAELAASTDPVLKELLETAREVCKRSSIPYGGAL